MKVDWTVRSDDEQAVSELFTNFLAKISKGNIFMSPTYTTTTSIITVKRRIFNCVFANS